MWARREREREREKMEAGRLKNRYSLNISTSANASFGSSVYVFDICSSWDNSIMAVSLSNNTIKLYSPTNGQFLGDCLGHTNTVTDILFKDPEDPHSFCSSSVDGTLRVWDTRSRNQVSMFCTKHPSQELYSFGIGGTNGNVVAAGSQAMVRFHPSKRDKLISAAVDGLICVFDTRGDINDDEGMDMVMGVGTSIGRIGFFGSTYDKLWCLTHIETLSIWDLVEGTQEDDFQDARSSASTKWSLPPVDYLVNCHYSSVKDRLWLVAGTSDGSLGYFPLKLNEKCEQSSSRKSSIGVVSGVIEGGHRGVVRCVWSPLNMQVGVAASEGLFCWTGGEDGNLCSWFKGSKGVDDSKAWVSTRLVKRKPSRKEQRPKPY